MYINRCLQKDDTLRKRYPENIDTDVKAGYVRKLEQDELNATRDKLQYCLPHRPVINLHNPKKSEQKATQQQNIKK